MHKITNRWRKQAEVYKIFAQSFSTGLDLSESAAEEMFACESLGLGDLEIDCFAKTPNGYAVGKKWLNVTVAMWRRDIAQGLLLKTELYADPAFNDVHWWLDKVLKDIEIDGGCFAQRGKYAQFIEFISSFIYTNNKI